MVTRDRRKRILVMGVHSFLDGHLKVGIQYIAEGLADRGWQVDYVSRFSSPIDIYGRQRHVRLQRVWLNKQDRLGIQIKPGLTEYAFRAPFPAHRNMLRYPWQLTLFGRLAPSWIDKRDYFACIHDVTANVIYLDRIHARYTILRLNDLPEGFAHTLSGRVIDLITDNMASLRYDEIWSSHSPLADRVLKLNPGNRSLTIPNGVDDDCYASLTVRSGNPKSAVYIGSINRRVDLNLIAQTAAILSDWQFDIIGPLDRSWTIRSANVKRRSPIVRSQVMATLSQYQVGLIPFRDVSGRLEYVEKPLKFLEYICAGLGVACTDVGALKNGMGTWASYGNSPEGFAQAIEQEARRAATRSRTECRKLVEPFTWANIVDTIHDRLNHL